MALDSKIQTSRDSNIDYTNSISFTLIDINCGVVNAIGNSGIVFKRSVSIDEDSIWDTKVFSSIKSSSECLKRTIKK